MILTTNAVLNACVVLNQRASVGNQRGRDLAATIYGLHAQGKTIEATVALENLPEDIRREIEQEETRSSDEEMTPSASLPVVRRELQPFTVQLRSSVAA